MKSIDQQENPQHVAHQRHEAELAIGAEVAALLDRPCSDAVFNLEREQHVVGQDAVMATPALQRQFERAARQRGAAQHAIGAPRQPAGEPAERLVVEFPHRGFRENLELRGGDARVASPKIAWRNMRPVERRLRRQPALPIGAQDRIYEGDRGYRATGRREKGQGLATAHGSQTVPYVAEKATSWAALAPDRD